MCDRCNGDYYICYECFDELVSTGACTDIETFMNTTKRNDKHEAYVRFDAAFPMREN